MAVTDTLRELREQVEQNLSEMKDTAALDALRVKVLGKKGTLTELLKGMGKLAPEERPKVGAQINEARQWLTRPGRNSPPCWTKSSGSSRPSSRRRPCAGRPST